MEWIDVNNRVPDNDRTVLFYSHKQDDVWIASIDSYGNWWVDEYGITKDITHWMELPSKPNN